MLRLLYLYFLITSFLIPNAYSKCLEKTASNQFQNIEHVQSLSSSQLKEKFKEKAFLLGDKGVELYRVKYVAAIPKLGVKALSGLFALTEGCKTNNPIIIYHHGTITDDRDAPSEAMDYGLIEASHGFNVLSPDYLGYGASKDVLHPYLIANTYGPAAKGLLDVYRVNITLNSKLLGDIFIGGYSEGGLAALSTLKYLEAHPLLGYKVKAASLGAGPYDLIATGHALLSAPVTDPLNMAFMISSYSNYHPDAVDSSKILKPIDGIDYDKLFLESHTYEQVYSLLPWKVSDLLYEDFTKKFLEETEGYMKDSSYPVSKLVLSLKENSRSCGWNPKAHIVFNHCSDDVVVPAISSRKAFECLSKNSENVTLNLIASPNPENPYTHISCPATYNYFNYFKKFL